MTTVMAVEPAVELELVMTPGMRDAALAVPPLSLLRDPAAASTMLHVRNQLAVVDGGMVAGSGLPELLPLLAGLDSAVIQLGQRTNAQNEWFLDGAALALDCGPATEGLSAWMDTMLVGAGERSHWQEFAGYSVDPNLFIGRDGTRFALGEEERLAGPVQALGQLRATPPDPQIHLTWHMSSLFAALELDGDGGHPLLDELLGAWRGTKPTGRVRMITAAGVWQASVAIDDMGRLPIAPLDGDIAAAACVGWPITLGLHMEPSAVEQVFSAVPEDLRALLPDHVAPLPLVAHLTGDYLLQARWDSSPIPEGALLLRLHDGAEAAPLVAEWAASLGATPLIRADADQAFTVANVAGLIVIARRGERLVIGTADHLVSAWLAGTPGTAPLILGCVAQVDLDLPTIATRWLPWAWAACNDYSQPLGDDPLVAVDGMVWELASALRRVAAPLSVSDALSHGEGFPVVAGHEPLQRLFPGPDLAQAVDAASALYVPDPPLPVGEEQMPDVRLVLHFAAGFTVFDNNNERRSGLDAAALDADLHGWKKLLGPDPAALVVLPTPEPAVLDRRWLPALPVALRHVPAYHLVVSSADFAVRAEERGLPLVSTAAIITALHLWNAPP